MSDEDLVELCFGECASCCFDLPHTMVTKEQRDNAIASHMDYLRRRNTPEYKKEQEEFAERVRKAYEEMLKKQEETND